MMPDLQIISTIMKICGWFAKLWSWLKGRLSSAKSSVTLEIPRKTIILVPEPRSNAFWWHMGSSGGQPGMQIVGDLNVTNICKYNILIIAAKLKKPKILGHASVRGVKSNLSGRFMIPAGSVTKLGFSFWVIPPVCEKGQVFKADVAIIDQFGNEHWMKGIEFKYS